MLQFCSSSRVLGEYTGSFKIRSIITRVGAIHFSPSPSEMLRYPVFNTEPQKIIIKRTTSEAHSPTYFSNYSFSQLSFFLPLATNKMSQSLPTPGTVTE